MKALTPSALLKGMLADSGVSQHDLSLAMGVSDQAVSWWLHRGISLERLQHVAVQLGYTVVFDAVESDVTLNEKDVA